VGFRALPPKGGKALCLPNRNRKLAKGHEMAIGESFNYLELSFCATVGTEGIDRRVIFRDVEFDDTHDATQVDNIIKGMERAGWEIHTALINTDNDSQYIDNKDAATVSAVFDALFESPEDAGKIIAYGELFGWMESNFERNRYGRKYEDGFYGVYDNAEEFAQEFVENDEEFSGILNSPYVSIDWELTADNLMNDFATHEYGYELYVFANH